MTYYIGNMPVGEDELYHYGIKGMRWGQRRWQNRDGSLTAAGRQHYYKAGPFQRGKMRRQIVGSGNRRAVRNAESRIGSSERRRKALRTGAKIAGGAVAIGAAAYLGKRYGKRALTAVRQLRKGSKGTAVIPYNSNRAQKGRIKTQIESIKRIGRAKDPVRSIRIDKKYTDKQLGKGAYQRAYENMHGSGSFKAKMAKAREDSRINRRITRTAIKNVKATRPKPVRDAVKDAKFKRSMNRWHKKVNKAKERYKKEVAAGKRVASGIASVRNRAKQFQYAPEALGAARTVGSIYVYRKGKKKGVSDARNAYRSTAMLTGGIGGYGAARVGEYIYDKTRTKKYGYIPGYEPTKKEADRSLARARKARHKGRKKSRK